MMQAVTQTVSLSWAIVLSPIMTALLTCITAYLGWRAKKDKDEVKETLKETRTETAAKMDAQGAEIHSVHTLVNNQYGIALALILEKSLKIYADKQTAENLAEVNRAKETLADHVAKQKIVDDKEKP
jgi:hypothetical protein